MFVIISACLVHKLVPGKKGEKLMERTQESLEFDKAKELLIRNITFCINKCNDISLLDLIYKLLKKSI